MLAPTILGFCKVDVNAFGPLQLYVAPAIKLAFKFNVWPAQMVELLVATGAIGSGLIVTDVVPIGLGQPTIVTKTE